MAMVSSSQEGVGRRRWNADVDEFNDACVSWNSSMAEERARLRGMMAERFACLRLRGTMAGICVPPYLMHSFTEL
ncbi:hypothetical protein Dimus_010230, partial [Dionaea muscipula]